MLSRNYPELFRALEPVESETLAPGRKPHSGKRGFLVDVPADLPLPVPGKGTVQTGAESLLYIDAAIGLWKARGIDAVVTGPVSKSFIEKSGCAFTGHTEYFAAAIGEDDPFMMMYSADYRVILATTHIPLHEVERSIVSGGWLKRSKRAAGPWRPSTGPSPGSQSPGSTRTAATTGPSAISTGASPPQRSSRRGSGG